ncbi:MAG TPA: hypothetical protein VF194_02385 [Ferrovibrio sp.]|uniref:hypothetical protein n=1 Tax=Ferrovibrio sp. TaxID=1917215 RepID=UPI002ED14F0C
MRLEPRFFSAIGTLRHAERLNFLTQDVRAAGTVLGFFGAAAALGAKPTELVLLVCRRYKPADLHRQIVIVFQQDRPFAESLAKLYRAHGRPLGFQGQQRWCAIPEPAFLRDETFALLAARFPTLLLIDEEDDGRLRIEVHASSGFKTRPVLKLAPLPQRDAPAAAAAQVMRMPPRPAVAAASLRPVAQPATSRPAQIVPLRPRKLKSGVALNETVERRVVDEFRRLLRTVAQYS